MNILFLTLTDFRSFDEHTIYTDLLTEFYRIGHSVYVISPTDRAHSREAGLIRAEQGTILKLPIGRVQKTGPIRKGIATVTLESKFSQGIRKYFSDVTFDLVVYSTPPITLAKVVKYIKNRDNAQSYLLL